MPIKQMNRLKRCGIYRKKNAVLPFVTTCIGLDDIMLCEIRDKYYMLLLACAISQKS